MPANSSTSILERAIRPGDDLLTPDVARYILRFGFAPQDQARVSQLLDKLKEEQITPDERTELEEFNRLNHMFTLLQSRARQALDRTRG